MAKGQKRGNREVKKPKQVKAQARPESPFGSQTKLAVATNVPRGKGRK